MKPGADDKPVARNPRPEPASSSSAAENVEFQLSGTGKRAAETVSNSEQRKLLQVCVLDDNHDEWLDEPGQVASVWDSS